MSQSRLSLGIVVASVVAGLTYFQGRIDHVEAASPFVSTSNGTTIPIQPILDLQRLPSATEPVVGGSNTVRYFGQVYQFDNGAAPHVQSPQAIVMDQDPFERIDGVGPLEFYAECDLRNDATAFVCAISPSGDTWDYEGVVVARLPVTTANGDVVYGNITFAVHAASP